MSERHVEVRAGAYADSVTLMQVSARVTELPGIRAALVAMATDLNLGLLPGIGLDPPVNAGSSDLLVAIRSDDGPSLSAALAVVDETLTARPASEAGERPGQRPRTTLSAVRQAGPGLVLISVPGQHAFAEAADALDSGCDVMIFSDNVSVEQEIVLKDIAASHDLLVMGPDCGTAIVAGIGLGFSHHVPPGPIGIVAASGTGAQQLICLLDAAGAGVSAVLGVGGRDLSAAVGGRSARAALAALDADPATELIVVVSKPPDDAVAAGLHAFAGTLATPVQFALIGPGQPDLTAAAQAALRAIGLAVPDWPRWDPPDGGTAAPAAPRAGTGLLRGLFAGGTLCDEAMVIAAERLGPVYSNVPLRPGWLLSPASPDSRAAAGGHGHAPGPARHIMIDFGEDELTEGRPHPMIDQRLRLAALAEHAADPDAAVIMLDVVLGYGAHPDPAAELAPAIAAARSARDLAVVVSLIGARSDPQGLQAQASALAAAGAHVFSANAQAARFACELIEAGDGRGSRPGAAEIGS